MIFDVEENETLGAFGATDDRARANALYNEMQDTYSGLLSLSGDFTAEEKARLVYFSNRLKELGPAAQLTDGAYLNAVSSIYNSTMPRMRQMSIRQKIEFSPARDAAGNVIGLVPTSPTYSTGSQPSSNGLKAESLILAVGAAALLLLLAKKL